MRLLQEIRFSHSVGLLYKAFTAFLGFEGNEGNTRYGEGPNCSRTGPRRGEK
jgi:hypothetical protein